MSFIRVLSGKVTKDSVVKDMRTGRGIKIHQLLDVQGGQVEAIDEAHAGDLVVVAKIDDFQVGDTLVNGDRGVTLPTLHFPTPMIGLAVEPKSRADQQKISGALHKIEEEDPTFRITRDPQTHEMVMRGMSDLHLQIVQERLHKRDKVDVHLTHAPEGSGVPRNDLGPSRRFVPTQETIGRFRPVRRGAPACVCVAARH